MTVVCPSSGLNPEVRHRVVQKQVAHIDRVFHPSDLDGLPPPSRPPLSSHSNRSSNTSYTHTTGAGEDDDGDRDGDGARDAATPRPPDMVLVAVDDPEASTQVWKLCRERRIPANVADVPSECDFYFGSVHRDGPLQVMVSTNGLGPRLAAIIRRWIARALPQGAGDAVERVGELRRRLRVEIAPGPADSVRRMRWVSAVSDAYSWDQMCALADEDLNNLLTFYADGNVPPFDALVALRAGGDGGDDGGDANGNDNDDAQPEEGDDEDVIDPNDVFDGSFGFAVGA